MATPCTPRGAYLDGAAERQGAKGQERVVDAVASPRDPLVCRFDSSVTSRTLTSSNHKPLRQGAITGGAPSHRRRPVPSGRQSVPTNTQRSAEVDKWPDKAGRDQQGQRDHTAPVQIVIGDILPMQAWDSGTGDRLWARRRLCARQTSDGALSWTWRTMMPWVMSQSTALGSCLEHRARVMGHARIITRHLCLHPAQTSRRVLKSRRL